uniref:Uncharacterized protein n=1 Tax=Corethron hystrix TaxID=216773 RepID=A0A7S1FQL5_9STRA|mmetsp:Transcript_23408/g.53419  ORF Transcript_23408/g.53419 Transcript_23408/m.53419 type:complete len:103 (+) Transcript_23408:319-627(+)
MPFIDNREDVNGSGKKKSSERSEEKKSKQPHASPFTTKRMKETRRTKMFTEISPPTYICVVNTVFGRGLKRGRRLTAVACDRPLGLHFLHIVVSICNLFDSI